MIATDERVARFVSAALDFSLCPPYTAMGVERRGRIVGGVLFNHFEGCDVHATVAGAGFTRGFMDAVGAYVFGQLDCQRITAITEQPSICRLGVRLGGQIEGRLRNHFGHGRDGIVIGILKDEWKYGR